MTRWTRERLRVELKAFLASEAEWPSYKEFQRRGKGGLREAVTRFGGAHFWAAQLGVPYVERPPGYAPIWTEDRIRSDLRTFLEGKNVWPSRKDFEAADKKTLRDAVLRTGGPERWAKDFGLPRIDQRSGSRRIWTDERIETELRQFLHGSDEWPTSNRFLEAGKASLLAAVYAWGGPGRWCVRLGIRRPRRHGPRRERQWTEQRIDRELREFCAGHSTWPSFHMFESAGEGALYRAASRHGGVRRWQRRVGLAP